MDELEMKQTGTELIEQSNNFKVTTEQDYKNAVEICKNIKFRMKQVEEYWDIPKSNSYKTWQDICAKAKQLLEPFANAEKEIKGKMVVWQKAKLEEDRLLREEQESYRKAEEERLMALAVKADAEGEDEHSEYLVEQAEVIHTAQFEQPKQVKVIGSAARTIWKARVTNTELVPVTANGFVIRSIDIGMLNKLAVMTKGISTIPGVEFYEDISISVRS